LAVDLHCGWQKQYRTGISGIERSMQQRNQVIDKNISQAFEDLSKLMDKVTVTKLCSVRVCYIRRCWI